MKVVDDETARATVPSGMRACRALVAVSLAVRDAMRRDRDMFVELENTPNSSNLPHLKELFLSGVCNRDLWPRLLT